MKLTVATLLLSVSLLLGADKAEPVAEEGRQPSTPNEVVGEQNLPVLKHPDHVYAVLLTHNRDDREAKHVTERTKRVELPAKQASAAVATLLNPKSYMFGSRVGCIPLYGARLVFVRDTKSVAIDYCFSCDILIVRAGDAPISGGRFVPSRAEFARLFKRLFPDDDILKRIE